MINQSTTYCEICGAEIQYYPSRRPNPRFCNRECQAKARRGVPSPNKLDLPTEKIKALYLQGQTLQQIADQFNTTTPTIASRLEEQGIERRHQGGATLLDPEICQRAHAALPKGENHHNYKALPLDEIEQAYEKGESTSSIASRYNVSDATIGRKLREYGAKLRPPGYRSSKRMVCSDGHKVQSSLEYHVDEWLYKHSIEHQVQPDCPWSTTGSSRYKADFLAKGYYIEVWGLDGNAQYDQRRKQKVKLYQECQAQLIQVFPHHISDKDFSPLEVLL